MVGIILEGEAAVVERTRLLEDGSEIPVAVRERDSHGKKRASWLQFGLNGSTAWVFCRDEGGDRESRIMLEGVLAHEAAELFNGYLERIELRRCLVDPSPLSPAFVEIQPSIKDVVADLAAEFGIQIPLS